MHGGVPSPTAEIGRSLGAWDGTRTTVKLGIGAYSSFE